MGELLLLGALLVGVVVLTPVSDRLSVPQPVLLTVFGLGVALVPGVAQPSLDPDLILPVLLPPLLFAASQRTTVGEFRESARPILLLAVGLTVATTGGRGRRRPCRWPALGGRLGPRRGGVPAGPGGRDGGRPPAAAPGADGDGARG